MRDYGSQSHTSLDAIPETSATQNDTHMENGSHHMFANPWWNTHMRIAAVDDVIVEENLSQDGDNEAAANGSHAYNNSQHAVAREAIMRTRPGRYPLRKQRDVMSWASSHDFHPEDDRSTFFAKVRHHSPPI